ncbi:ABC transporter substrate-binding protein [Telmatospirillum sp.]|uniref:ABC transporter substrate-binding protein n=1 Tax=Telmatospirillum sp. TaxID=2079197 RepID=UPI0028471E9E|nr:ABC transporter substrate-binding protein [Telmatospirillum sp.]MDR3440961.1 ABC transporter substrate-binding protein [Telmatospirillum sp.]
MALKRLGAIVAMAVAVVAGAASAQTKQIVLGYELPLSGDSAHYGEAFRNAAEIGLADFKAAGGLPGADIVIRYEDSKNDAREARNIAQMFADDKSIIGVLGDFSSTVSMAAAEIYAKSGVPQLSQTASHPDFVKISKWQFRNITTQSYEGPFNAEWMREKGHTKVAVVAIQNDWGLSAASSFADAFKAKGGAISSIEYFNPGTRDFRSILTKINRTKPDAIYLCMFYEEGASFLQQRQQLNVAAAVFGASSLYNDQLIALAGPAVDGLMLSSNFVPTNPDPKVQAFVNAYNTKYGAIPNQFAAQAYDAVGIMLTALKKTGVNATRDSLRDALAQTKDYPGITGQTTFDPETREPVKTVVRMMVSNGKFSVVP